MLELFQTEWCPASRLVRQRLTELGLDYVNRQVPVEREARTALRELTGADTIPALRLENGSVIVGEENVSPTSESTSPNHRMPNRIDGRRKRRAVATWRRSANAPPAGYTLSEATGLPFREAVERVRVELRAEGFGVLCEIDVQATLREKLGIEREPYTILGACNPTLAHEALEAEPDLGVLLPCNVIVYRTEGRTHVSAVDAERMLSIVGGEQLAPIATEVTRRLADVVARTAGKAATHTTG